MFVSGQWSKERNTGNVKQDAVLMAELNRLGPGYFWKRMREYTGEGLPIYQVRTPQRCPDGSPFYLNVFNVSGGNAVVTDGGLSSMVCRDMGFDMMRRLKGKARAGVFKALQNRDMRVRRRPEREVELSARVELAWLPSAIMTVGEMCVRVVESARKAGTECARKQSAANK